MPYIDYCGDHILGQKRSSCSKCFDDWKRRVENMEKYKKLLKQKKSLT